MSMINFEDDNNNGYEDEKLKTVFHDDEVVEENDEVESGQKKEIVQVVIESQIIDESINDISPQVITKEMRSSFLDYAMSVIVARALPDAYDGLKPVHRRILYSMAELGIDYNKAHKKSARIVGETMGKYHPHGDAAIYEAMVRMAQPFSMRYLLVEGHGNFGSIDGDGAAAMRYTEARLSKLSSFMVDGIEKNSVDFIDNYDATEKEPVVLPARFPNLLVSGSTGIAVGMATNIPPHNIGEVIDAVITLAKNPEATIEELMMHVKGPDFPTGAIILGTEGIKEAYTTGNGSITTRSKADIQTNTNTGKQRIIISEIPYMVNKAKLVEKIALLVKDRVIEGIISIRDESNREGIRIVFDIGKNAVAEVVLNKLYKLTPLQTNFGVNFIALDQGQPKTMTLKSALECYIQHQKNVVLRKSQFDLEKAEKRAHILIGLKIAINNIDEVIQIIKKSVSDLDAQANLIKRFGLSEEQAKAITEMRLGRLTGLAIEKMDLEIEELKVQIFELGRIINQPERLIEVIIAEQEEVKSLFADKRRTSIIEGVGGSIDEEDLIPQRDIAITLSVKGYVKRMPLEEYRTQRRGGVGTKAITTYEDDDVRMIVTTTTHTDLLIFTKSARVFRIRAYKIPSLSKQAKGIPFINLIDIDKEDEVVSLLPINEYPENKYLMTISKNGILKKTKLSEYERINKNGKYALGLKEGDELFKAMVVEEEDEIVIGSREGKVVRFKSSDVRSMGRTAAGVKGINLSDSKTNYVVGADVAHINGKVLSIGDYGHGKMTEVAEYRQTKRGAKGVKTIDIKKTGKLVSIMVVDGSEDIIVLTSKGVTIRTTLTQVSTISRSTKGVTIIKLEEGVKIRSVAMIDIEKVEEEVEKAIERTQEMNVKALRSDANLNTEELSENDNIEDHSDEKQ